MPIGIQSYPFHSGSQKFRDPIQAQMIKKSYYLYGINNVSHTSTSTGNSQETSTFKIDVLHHLMGKLRNEINIISTTPTEISQWLRRQGITFFIGKSGSKKPRKPYLTPKTFSTPYLSRVKKICPSHKQQA